MDGQITLLVPGDEEAAVTASVAYGKISSYAEIKTALKYDSEREAVKSAAKSAANGENCYIVADENRFNNVKLFLLKALSVKVLRSETLTDLIGDKLSEKSKEHKIQTALPQDAELYPTKSGLNSAFSFGFKNGSITLLPIDAEALDEVLAAGALGFEDEKAKNKNLVKVSMLTFDVSGKTAAVANNATAKFLTDAAAENNIEGKIITAEASSELDPGDDEYIAQIAKSAAENGKCNLGVAISEKAEDGTVKVCVADSNNAVVEIVHPVEGEGEDELFDAALVRAATLLAKSASEEINPPKKEYVRFNTKPLIIIIILLAVSAIACITIGAVIYRNSVSKADVSGESTTAEISEIAYTEESEEDDGFGEVVPLFDEVDEESLFDAINTTYNGAGITGNAANGGYTTNSDGNFETVRTSANATVLSETTANIISKIVSNTRRSQATAQESGEDDENENESESESTATTAVTTTTAKAESASQDGKFIFTVYGYGHGVGMSQRGAIAYANKGWTFSQILCHYYQGITLKVDKDTPAEITKGGTQMTLVEFLCKTVKKEIGPTAPKEALKAQAVAAYTFAMCNGFDGQQAFDYGFQYQGTQVEQAVFDVLHITSEDEQPHAIYCSYNDRYINAVYFASSAGKTTSSKSVWGTSMPYCGGGCTSPETVEISTREFTVSQMKNLISGYFGSGVSFDENPYNWLKIVSHDGAYSNAIGYVDTINVCGRTISGNAFREKLMGRSIKSHCFTIKYVKYS